MVFRSTIGLNAFGVEYEGLFGFGMITEVDRSEEPGRAPTNPFTSAETVTEGSAAYGDVVGHTSTAVAV